MWKPDEAPDDYTVQPNSKVISEPPRAVSLQRTGEVEILQPLARSEVSTTLSLRAIRASRKYGRHQPLWFRRFLAVGSGALVMIALILVSAILVGINDPMAGPDVAAIEEPNDGPTQSEEPFSLNDSSSSIPAQASGGVDIVRSNTIRRPARSSMHVAAYKVRRLSRPTPPLEPKFVPTTLVIYAENGVIYTRIEPWLQTPTFDN